MGIDGKPSFPLQTGPLPCHIEGLPFTHSFLVIPSCPVPLLGRDVLFHLGASLQLVRLDPKVPSSQLLLPLLGLSLEPSPSYPPLPITPNPINPQVWDTSKPIIATHHSPVLIRLKDPSKFPSRPQFPISETHLRSLQPIITRLLNQGLLIPTDSPCNTPILPVPKASGDYRLVQDLRIINEAMIPLHPVVPNPYTLLSHIPPSTTHFTVLDLKDAFFTIPLHPDSYFLFAFTWTDPDTHTSSQLAWTVLPQGFRDSPHLFGQALARDLTSCSLTPSTLLQYVDDLLLCSPSLSLSRQHTADLLNYLGSRGYRVSPAKAQLSVSSVTYLGSTLPLPQKV